MGLRSHLRSRTDHGERLYDRYERQTSKLHERVAHRREVVKSRLASLEDEHHTLGELHSRLTPREAA